MHRHKYKRKGPIPQVLTQTNRLFVTELVKGKYFRKFRKLRYALYMFLMLTGFILFFYLIQLGPGKTFYQKMLEDVPVMTTSFTLLLITTLTIYIVSVWKRPAGVLEIFEDKLVISSPRSTLSYKFEDIESLKIERGSTYHHHYKANNYLVKVDNFVSFWHNGQRHQYEFEIDSQRKNEMFEEMIERLQDKMVKFKYKSI